MRESINHVTPGDRIIDDGKKRTGYISSAGDCCDMYVTWHNQLRELWKNVGGKEFMSYTRGWHS